MKLEMVRVQLVGLKTALLPTVETLRSLRCVQIEDAEQAAGLLLRPLCLEPEMVRVQERTSYLLARIEGMLTALNLTPDGSAPPSQAGECLAQADAGLDVLGPQLQSLLAQRDKLRAEQASLPRYVATLQKLLPILPASARDPANASIGILVSRAHARVLESVAAQVSQLASDQVELLSEDVDAGTRALLIILPQALAPEVDRLLGQQDISRLRLPEGYHNQPPDAVVAALRRRLAEIPREVADLDTQLAGLAGAWRDRLLRWHACLRASREAFSVLPRFGETDHAFVMEGWTPRRDVPRLQSALRSSVGDAVVLHVRPLSHADQAQAPVILNNPGPARPFESLVRLLALPRYDGLDPTLLMALALPLFFGLMLGDVGYGALLLGLSLLALRRFRSPGMVRDLAQVMLMGSLWGIAFGFLYGEAFGTLGEYFGLHPIWLDRASPDQVTGLLLFSIAVGAVHLTLGLLLGLWEAIRERSRSHLLERGGMLAGLVGLFLIVATVVEWLPQAALTPGVAVMIVGIVLMSVPMGWVGLLAGPIEFIGLIGNVLSYLRLAAIGLASLYLARVANELAGSLGSLLVGVIVAVLIHALNLVMGAFSPTIHSLRLHYVEFFRKFYEGGGRPFAPFGG